jgi:hypothetical protein
MTQWYRKEKVYLPKNEHSIWIKRFDQKDFQRGKEVTLGMVWSKTAETINPHRTAPYHWFVPVLLGLYVQTVLENLGLGCDGLDLVKPTKRS